MSRLRTIVGRLCEDTHHYTATPFNDYPLSSHAPLTAGSERG